MSTLGDLQKRLTAIFTEAKAQYIKPQDVIPPEVQAHFGDLKELKTAREYIKEVEEREMALVDRNEDLEKELKQAKQAVEDLPDDHKQRLIDLQQAQHQIKFYKDLMEYAEQRALNYQAKWQEALKKQATADEAQQKIERLEAECYDHKAVIVKLINENHGAHDIYDSIREKDLKALEDKEVKLMEMEKFVQETEDRYKQVEEEKDQFEQTYDGLIEKLDGETSEVAAALNNTSGRLRVAERLRIATVSEVTPLRKFYESAHSIISIYQHIFQGLLNTEQPKVQWIPDALRASIDSAAKECEAFYFLRQAIDSEGIESDEVRDQINLLGRSAVRMHGSLEAIAGDVSRFLATLRRRPDVWQLVKMKFGILTRR
ncbi:hypothetical protein BU26DRAFT_429332 [Trematosphaeria pertusa]|uniref:Uncharacterized protein n=1 Tax=Trematosphaeria pertusa TaxID=390896 RepID=A0A6A6IAA7_9PLEO|nr:uncharacterized protein BU26DRAFT_429332 [Trematosphaeria pertusa]KAF2247311.1 hypothetical protein BU26DRAFT_429332 [Trematosphaeria pertusa]